MSVLMIIVFLVTASLSAGALFAVFRHISNDGSDSSVADRDALMNEIRGADEEIKELLARSKSYCSRGQFETVSNQLTGLQSELEKEKKALADLEQQLDTAQTTVEEKEAHQQELKSSREEDEIKLEELLGNYAEISSESISLEQRLAQSMKNLDALSEEIELTEDQKAVLDELGSSLGKAGENLRNLLMEYETVNERLNLLREQHEDLEEEYTKLVEQQLGE
ncbi:MAG: hypothetical protein KDD64_03545 [Bdellovibrionales bacterium]|nr:hypothetical protein [Bdellovibrionales bacterium]